MKKEGLCTVSTKIAVSTFNERIKKIKTDKKNNLEEPTGEIKKDKLEESKLTNLHLHTYVCKYYINLP